MNKQFQLLLVGLLGTSVACGADIVVIVNSAAATPTEAQVADVYLGRSRAYTPLDQAEASPIRAEFYQRATGRDLAQVKSTWSRIVFTGKGQPPKELPDPAAVKQAVAADPKAIGYIDKSSLDATVKVALTLN